MPTTWMPIYWGDYLKDTQHLSTEEHGAYLLLISYYWCNGKIPRDVNILKNITRISEKKLHNVIKFFRVESGFYVHDRIEKELAQALENKEKQTKRTEAATQARWKRNVSVTDTVTSTPSPSPSPSPSPLPKEKESESKNTHNLFNFCLALLPDEDREAFKLRPEEYMPKELGQEWIDRKGVDKEAAMWRAWSKFFNYNLEKPPRGDWKILWINWVTNEVIYDIQKKRG